VTINKTASHTFLTQDIHITTLLIHFIVVFFGRADKDLTPQKSYHLVSHRFSKGRLFEGPLVRRVAWQSNKTKCHVVA